MTLDLSMEEMRTLKTAIDRAVQLLETELAHTDAPSMQHALNADYRRLVDLRDRMFGATRNEQDRISAAAI